MRRLLMLLVVILALCWTSYLALGLLQRTNAGAQDGQTTILASPTTTLPEAMLDGTALLPETATPVLTPTLAPSPSPTVEPNPTSNPGPLFVVRYHPDQALYVGDQVSWEVIAPAEADLSGQAVTVWVDGQSKGPFGPQEFVPFGIQGRMQATFTWVWDTSDLEPGPYTLTYSVDPAGYRWEEILTLEARHALPSPELYAQWVTTESGCCEVHYISGTEAERDLEVLLGQMDKIAQPLAERMGSSLEEPVSITLLPRVLGHGGFAGDGISISYLDRNYAGSNFEMVFHHEMVHILDGRLGGELRPTILVEGLAVYLSGGHYKPEAILPRAAALLQITDQDTKNDLGWYQELALLTDNFYPTQHEIGYLQAGALVEFMIQTWGWEAFNTFYRDIQPHPSGSQAQAMQAALQKHFEIDFAELEHRFLEELRRQEVTPEHIHDVRLTVEFYESVRRYQQYLDPSAYFMTTWLVDRRAMQERGIIADYVRRPISPENILLEEMLVSTHRYLVSGAYGEAELALESLQAKLDEFQVAAGLAGETMLWAVPDPIRPNAMYDLVPER